MSLELDWTSTGLPLDNCLHSSKASYPDLSELLVVHHFLVITYMIHIDRTDLMLTFSCQFDILFEDETYAYKDR